MKRIGKMYDGRFVIIEEKSDIGEQRYNITKEVAPQVVCERLSQIAMELRWLLELLNEYFDTPPCYVGVLGTRECRSINADQCNCKFAPKL